MFEIAYSYAFLWYQNYTVQKTFFKRLENQNLLYLAYVGLLDVKREAKNTVFGTVCILEHYKGRIQ